MRALLLALALACGGPPPAPAATGPVEVRSWIEGGKAGGTLVVQTTFDPAGQVTQPEPPAAGGLELKADGEPVRERVGAREVVTQRFAWTAPKGNYEIPGAKAHWKGPAGEADATSTSLFVDVQADPLGREGDLADIQDPPRVRTIPWRAIGIVAGVGGLLLGGIGVAFFGTRRRAPLVVPPEPPDVVALRAWDAVRKDPSLDDYAKAVQISRIFREYTEAVLGFPATAWTTSEILDRLASLAHLPEGNVPRAKRLLRATDRVKFAGEQAKQELFEELDADLRAFVGTTRPHQWRPE